MEKKRQIEMQLEIIEQRLANGEAYVAKGVNREGTGFFHFDDWHGNSGHPLWMQNFMIPATQRRRTKKELALDRIVRKEREMRLMRSRGRARIE